MKHTTNSRFRQLPCTSPLSRLLSQHDDDHRTGFITRLDRSTVSTKRWTFMTAFAFNAIVLLLITCVVLISLIHEFTYARPTPLSTRIIVWAIQNIIISVAVTIILQSTTLPFFYGEFRLRLLYGFRPTEVIIRKCPIVHRQKHGSEEEHMQHYWRTAVHAINPRLLYSTASAILSSEYWTVEYDAVLDALHRISKKEIDEQDLEFSIWKRNSENTWSIYELWRMHEIMTDQQEIAMFKNFLAQSGKAELLRIWEEMLPLANGARCIHSAGAYQNMVSQFAQEGLDYETLWSRVYDRAM